MILGAVDLHNTAEVQEVAGRAGVRLQRVPEAVRLKLNPGAQQRMLDPAGAEIRFALQDEQACVTLSNPEGRSKATVFFGPFFLNAQYEIGAAPQRIELATPPRLKDLPEDLAAQLAFSPRVCRVALRGGPLFFHGVEGSVRPPAEGETPKLRMLSYGTSITHGAAATAFHLAYVAQTAWRLGADLCNLGVGGACHCEPALADYIAEREDWDFATLCLSVNMIGAGFTVEEFRERARYLIRRLAESDRRRVVACISILPYFGDWGMAQPNAKGKPAEFRRALGEVVEGLKAPNVRLFEGPDLLRDVGGLTVDLIHPGDHGMIQIGENLAARLRPLVENLRRSSRSRHE